MGKGRRYDQEYKDMIVDLFKSGISLAELSSEYGIAKSTINGWIKDVKEIKVDENEVMTLKEVKELKKEMDDLKLSEEYANRYVNVGFSGGERKKSEILQLKILNPKLAMLDETDSGLDVDAVRIVSEGIKNYLNEDNAVIVVTHHNELLENIDVDYVHVLKDGVIKETSDASLMEKIEKEGYEWV